MSLLLAACGELRPLVSGHPADPAPVKDSGNIKAEGKSQPVQFVNLICLGGEVAEVLVKEGDTVKAGDVIARIKSDLQQAAVAALRPVSPPPKPAKRSTSNSCRSKSPPAKRKFKPRARRLLALLAQRNDPARPSRCGSGADSSAGGTTGRRRRLQESDRRGQLGPTEEQARLAVVTAKKRNSKPRRLRLNQ